MNYENLVARGNSGDLLIGQEPPAPVQRGSGTRSASARTAAPSESRLVKKILPHFDWTTGLTGTPASNGYKDLHGQYLVVDKGCAWGPSKTAFDSRFYRKVGPIGRYRSMARRMRSNS